MPMPLTFSSIKTLLVEAGKDWMADKASRLGAALAYYTVFSIAPLLLITIAIVGFVYGEEAAYGGITAQIGQLVGTEGAKAIESMVENAGKEKSSGIVATVIGFALLLFGASGVFVQLKDAMNTLWEIPESKAKGGILGFIKTRFLSFGLVLGVGFLLLVSLLISSILSGAGKYVAGFSGMGSVLQIFNFVVSFAVITGLFAMIFKFLPDIRLPWRDVLLGAVVTSLLFSIGKFVIGIYLGRGSLASTYGAAGSFVVLLVWIYYSAQIVFFGAELTQAYSRRFGTWEAVAATARAPGGNNASGETQIIQEQTGHSAKTQANVVPQPISKSAPERLATKAGKLAGYGIAIKTAVQTLRGK